ncbi:hypothetical protein K504DRAFT_462973 [Pleomassaria siparia CBS 279.74]|uniref:CENP-T/Histone H4 histone fold domain-containing protein n=1 Tax=Pleomassaria siparia CBS 279.74 TaxID=1314801 RepID=A0A6G1JUQ6_9PLEO|nr:hypothetical protein K504DRAFT_462973 [Pleomassaria siparia CBS 279.74]
MSASARKKARISPPHISEGTTATETLYADLHQLSGILPTPTTPHRRAASAGPTSGGRPTPNIVIRTPGTAARTPRGGPTRHTSARRNAPTTPHAIRALRERANAARTPGLHRRRSGRVQRETPRDMLRDLSRVLARDTRPVQPSPQDRRSSRNAALDLPDVEDGPELVAPRLSMPLGDMYDDDSFHDAPPRRSLLPYLPNDVDNGTVQSLEFGRRALSEDPRMMYGTRLSERFADLNELGIEGEEYEIDGTFINRRPGLDGEELLQEDIEGMDDTTTEMRALTGRRDGRMSDVNLGVFGEVDDEDDEPTFRFTIPQRIQAPMQDERLEDLQEEPEEEPQEEVEEELEEEPQEELEEEPPEEQSEEEGGADAGLDGNVDSDEELPAPVEDPTGGIEITGWESDQEADGDADLQAYREEVSAMDRSLQTQSPERSTDHDQRPRKLRKEIKTSRIGLDYSSFNAATVKRLANGFAKSHSKTKISKDTLAALVQSTDWFFEQMGEDLKAFADHGGRKMIEESDVIAIMKRSRQITSNSTPFSLAQKMLPRELLQELRMEPAPKLKRQKRKRMERIEEEEAD